jgi:hypothetical protein
MANRPSSFFKELRLQKNDKALSNKAQREHEAIVALFRSAPGQDLSSAKETLCGAVNAITSYADHVRSGQQPRPADGVIRYPGSKAEETITEIVIVDVVIGNKRIGMRLEVVEASFDVNRSTKIVDSKDVHRFLSSRDVSPSTRRLL